MYDNRGKVRYFIGAQIDITGLVEDGRGVESFEKYLIERKQKEAIENEEDPQEDITSSPLKTLSELGKLLSPEEVAIVQSGKEKDNTMRDDASMGSNGRRDNQSRAGRRIIGVERHDQDMGSDRSAYVGSSLRMSGRLPGVYQNVSRPTKVTLESSTLSDLRHSISFCVHSHPYASFSCLPVFEYLDFYNLISSLGLVVQPTSAIV